ncbi:hypothetical protein [Micromonospora chalcea]|uniref:hypothetical protein n=1 Tax=Micromonospora chalcea TaxID=1874 RepID=UPI003F49B51E
MSPITTGIVAASAFDRSRSTIGTESSMPLTRTPRPARGTATRPVPMANSSTGPSPASAASRSTAGSSTSGANIPVPGVSYRSAVSPFQISSWRIRSPWRSVPDAVDRISPSSPVPEGPNPLRSRCYAPS